MKALEIDGTVKFLTPEGTWTKECAKARVFTSQGEFFDELRRLLKRRRFIRKVNYVYEVDENEKAIYTYGRSLSWRYQSMRRFKIHKQAMAKVSAILSDEEMQVLGLKEMDWKQFC